MRRQAKLEMLGGLVVLALAVATPARAGRQEVWTDTYPLDPGGRVEVVNVQGSIRVQGWDRAEVGFTVVKRARSEKELGAVGVAVESRGNLLRARTVYLQNFDDPPPVHYRLRVPRQVELRELRTVNGRVEVREVEGAIGAYTLNGDILQIDVAGSVEARALNGSVKVCLRRMPGAGGTLQLETVNGDLHLLLPPEADADLELSTVAGRIESDLLYEVAGRQGRALRTRLGRGGVPISLRTIRGQIRLEWNDDLL